MNSLIYKILTEKSLSPVVIVPVIIPVVPVIIPIVVVIIVVGFRMRGEVAGAGRTVGVAERNLKVSDVTRDGESVASVIFLKTIPVDAVNHRLIVHFGDIIVTVFDDLAPRIGLADGVAAEVKPAVTFKEEFTRTLVTDKVDEVIAGSRWNATFSTSF